MTSMRDNRVLNRMAQLSPQQLKQLASRKSEQRGAGLPARQLQGLRRAGEKLRFHMARNDCGSSSKWGWWDSPTT